MSAKVVDYSGGSTLTFYKIVLFSRNDMARKEGDSHGLR